MRLAAEVPVVPRRAPESSEIRSLVKVSFLLRLFTLLASLLGFVDRTLTPAAAGAIIFLAMTSMAGLSLDDLPDLLQRHPSLIALDALVMTGLMLALGTDNPLILASLSSAVVIGVVLSPLPAVLSGVVMVNGYLFAELGQGDSDTGFIEAFGFPITVASVIALGQAFRTVAQRKRESERAFADLVSGASAAQERARLARELHDSTAKTLQGLALSARSLKHWIDKDPDRALDEAGEIATTADDAVVRLRQLLSTLRQDDLTQPFHESLASLVRDVAQSFGVKPVLDLEAVPLSAPGVRYELLAAVKEAVTNAATHSGSDRVAVSMEADEATIRITVRDQGSGFSLDSLAESELDGHFGVRGYAERLAQVGGHADVRTAPGDGTLVTLTAPMMGLQEDHHHV
jgi:signal transduction histidine kinase